MQSMPSGFIGEYYPVDIVQGQPVPRKLYAQKHNHYSVLATIQQLWSLGCLANTGDTQA